MESPKSDGNVASAAISPVEKIESSRARASLCTQRLNVSSFPTIQSVFNSPHPRIDIGGSSSNHDPRGQFYSALETHDPPGVVGEYRAADPEVNHGEPPYNDDTNNGAHVMSLVEISDAENIWNHVESNEFMEHHNYVGQGLVPHAGFLGPNLVTIPIENCVNQAMSTQFPSQVLQFNNDPCFNQFAGSVEELSRSEDSSNRKRNRETCSYDIDGCKLCNCKKTKCLKLYCECFAAGIYCEDRCACEDCLNKPDYDDTIQDVRLHIEQRNPLAFAPRIVNPPYDSPNVTAIGDGNSTNTSSARHKKGCKCKKSKCLKKYCECYRAKVGCSDACHCDHCDNSFGKKPESVFQRVESLMNQSHETPNMGEVRSGTTNVWTANQFSPTWENLSTHPYNMRGSQNVSWTESDWYLSALCPKQQFPSKVSRELHPMDDICEMIGDDIPEFIMEDSNTKKSVSPNQKRISPPKLPSYEFGSNFPPGQPLTARKLVLHEAETSCFPTTPTYRNSDDRVNHARKDQGCNHDQ